MNKRPHILNLSLVAALFLALAGCGKKCDSPNLNVNKLQSLKRELFSAGPSGYLVVPNPIEATKNLAATISDSRTQNAFQEFRMDRLIDANRLENDFVKVRIHDTNDDASTLAKPNGQGQYGFKIEDVHYSEVMAYQSILSEMTYLEQLGFTLVKSRPLYVMVRAAERSKGEINALYDHNYLSPQLPRTIRLFGDTQFAPGMDREMYWHEFGHYFNESASHEVGMDFAGDTGAVFSEGAAMHECLADYLNYTMSNSPTIGRWLARNLPDHPAGEPLRTALDKNDGKSNFKTVITNDGTGGNPERYTVAEWCTRVLWEVRQGFLQRDPQAGGILADRLVYSAVSLFHRDASIQDLQKNLLSADDQLYCGDNSSSIEGAFSSRGFVSDPDRLGSPLIFSAQPVALDNGSGGSRSPMDFNSTSSVGFQLVIRNGNNATARNVRVRLDSTDSSLHVVNYQQGYGDLPPGKSLSIGGGQLGYDSSVMADIDRNVPTGKSIRYRIRVFADNGGENILEGQVSK